MAVLKKRLLASDPDTLYTQSARIGNRKRLCVNEALSPHSISRFSTARVLCSALPLVDVSSLTAFLVARKKSIKRPLCSNSSDCAATAVLLELGFPDYSLSAFRPRFVATLSSNTRCLLCVDRDVQRLVTLALWSHTQLSVSDLTHRLPSIPTKPSRQGFIPLHLLKSIGIDMTLRMHATRHWTVRQDPLTDIVTLNRC